MFLLFLLSTDMNNNEIESDAEDSLHCRFCHQDVEENEWDWEFSLCGFCRTQNCVSYCDYCDEEIQMIVDEVQLFPEGEYYPRPPEDREEDDDGNPDLILCPECVTIYINNYPNWETFCSDEESEDETKST